MEKFTQLGEKLGLEGEKLLEFVKKQRQLEGEKDEKQRELEEGREEKGRWLKEQKEEER